MIIVDSTCVSKDYMESVVTKMLEYAWASPLYDDLQRILNRNGPVVIITDHVYSYMPTLIDESRIAAVTRRINKNVFIVMMRDEKARCLLAHELVHCAGGLELDAEWMEHLIAFWFKEVPIIGLNDLDQFAKEGSRYSVSYNLSGGLLTISGSNGRVVSIPFQLKPV